MCGCGEEDPDFVHTHEHNFVDGVCECKEPDPTTVGSGVITFEGMEPIDPSRIKISSTDAAAVVNYEGDKALKVSYSSDRDEKITITPTMEADADKFVFEITVSNLDAADSVSADQAQFDIRFCVSDSSIPVAKSNILYDFRINGKVFMCEGGGQWLASSLPNDATSYTLRVELTVVDGKLVVKTFVNGVENTRLATVFGASYTNVKEAMPADLISSITAVEIADSRTTANGIIYFDNVTCGGVVSAE